jgi:hypothetical protein
MKKLFLLIALSCSALIPTTPAKAQEAPTAPILRGGIAPGTVYTVRVIEIISIKIDQKGKKKKVSIPRGVPKFQKGQTITFTIGAEEQVSGPGFSFPYRESYVERGYPTNDYGARATKRNPIPNGVSIARKTDGSAKEIQLGFVKWNRNSSSPSATVVVYRLK